MKYAKKSAKRANILSEIMSILKSDEIYETIDYRNQSEDKIKQFIYRPLLEKVSEIEQESGVSKKTADKKARKNLLWEGNMKTTVNNVVLFGTQHRPDMVLNIAGVSIAIEIKRGEIGSSIREGVGQSVVYAENYDFCVYLYIDTSKEKKILNSVKGDKEQRVIGQLWNNHNVMFGVV